MLSRLARAVLVLATMFVVSSFARSAFAAGFAGAPFCDDRGATGLAAKPDLQPLDMVIRSVRAASCDSGSGGDSWTLLRSGRAPDAGARATADDRSPTQAVALVVHVPEASSELRADGVEGRPPSGSRSRVERPPRG